MRISAAVGGKRSFRSGTSEPLLTGYGRDTRCWGLTYFEIAVIKAASNSPCSENLKDIASNSKQASRENIASLAMKTRGQPIFPMALTIAAVVASLWSTPQVSAAPCLASPSCTLDGQTFTVTGGTSGNSLTFIASFTTPNQSNSSIATLADDYLKLLGVTVTYLGRQDGSGEIDGDSVSVTGEGDTTGTWTFSPGTAGDVGSYVAIHAGSGQTDTLFEINSPGTSGTWGTENGKGLSNFDLFGTPAPAPAPLIGHDLPALLAVGGILFGAKLLERNTKGRSPANA